MNSLVIGLGEIGKAVQAVTRSEFTLDISGKDNRPKDEQIDIMHICFPWSKGFTVEVWSYIETYKPEHIIVWSTVPVGTCRDLGEKVVHSPVEGMHPDLEWSIRHARRWVGFNNGDEGRFFVKYFMGLGLQVWFVSDTETTELAKLRSTAKFGINIVWAQYEDELCKKFGVSYEQLMCFDRDYNELYKKLDPNMQRYILYPPNGKIGGHCVVPNAEILQTQFPNDLVEKVIAMRSK